MLSDRDICHDVLKDLKYMSVIGAALAGEASPDIKHLFVDQLRTHQDIHTQFTRLVEQRGWYPRVPGDWGYAEPYTAPSSGQSWQATQPAGGWQPQATTWQGQNPGGGGGAWQPGPSLPTQTLQQNLREQR